MTILSLDNSIRKAEKLLKNKNFEEAKIEFSEIIKKFPKNLRAINGLKKASVINNEEEHFSFDNKFSYLLNLYNNSKFEKVLIESKKILNNVKDSHLILNLMGASNVGLKKFDNALKNYLDAINIKPDFSDAYNNIGHLYNQNGNYNKAIDYFKTLRD